MPSNTRLLAIVDHEGNVVAAQFAQQDTGAQGEDVPSVSYFHPLEGQRLISVDVPAEVMELPGPDLHRFLSQVRVIWPAEVQVPKLNIVRKAEVQKKKKR
jgi:hypothetical protein